MKRLLPLTIVTVLFLGCTSAFSQNFDNPVEYMDFIGKQQENISKKYMSYTSASAHGKRAKKVESLRNKLLNEVQEARMNISGMPSCKGDKEYRDTAVNFMKLYYNVLNDDYAKVIDLEEIAEQSYDDMEAYLMAQEKIDEKLEEGNKRFSDAAAKFATSNNIRLIKDESELGSMLKQVAAMHNYYHDVYLIFFRPYKQETYLSEAIAKGNITAIEQNKNSLLKYAQEGLEKLNGMKGFQGDNSVVLACKGILNFYVKEAEKIDKVSEYFLTKERFEATKKEFDKKGNSSKAEVDAYNKAVNDINSASEAYNNNNQYLNQSRKEYLDAWNRAVTDFFDTHTPRYK